MEAVKQNTSSLFPTPHFMSLLMDLNVTKTGFCNISLLMTPQRIDYTAATGHLSNSQSPHRKP